MLDIAKQVLEFEAKTVAAQIESLDEGFLGLARYLVETDNNVFVAGIGKSGIVARSLSAKLASIGVRSALLSATDALHGELGVLRADDVLILLSNSGATQEVVDVGKAALQRGTQVAGMVARVPSPLSRLARWTLRVQVEREATEMQLPTASAIAMLALSDALVLAVAHGRKVTVDDFARNHPGGSLGVLIGSRVEDHMSKAPEEVALVGPEETMHATLVKMTRHPRGAGIVVDGDRTLLGIITDGDIRRGLTAVPDRFLQMTAAEVMTRSPLTCRVGDSVMQALKLMEGRKQVYVLPVVDADGRVAGLLRMHAIANLNMAKMVEQA